EGRGIERRVVGEAEQLRRLPGQLLRQAEGAERRRIRTAAGGAGRQPSVKAAEGLVRSATRGIKGVERLEHQALQAEHRLEGALEETAKELRPLGEQVAEKGLNRP